MSFSGRNFFFLIYTFTKIAKYESSMSPEGMPKPILYSRVSPRLLQSSSELGINVQDPVTWINPVFPLRYEGRIRATGNVQQNRMINMLEIKKNIHEPLFFWSIPVNWNNSSLNWYSVCKYLKKKLTMLPVSIVKPWLHYLIQGLRKNMEYGVGVGGVIVTNCMH